MEELSIFPLKKVVSVMPCDQEMVSSNIFEDDGQITAMSYLRELYKSPFL